MKVVTGFKALISRMESRRGSRRAPGCIKKTDQPNHLKTTKQTTIQYAYPVTHPLTSKINKELTNQQNDKQKLKVFG